MEYWEKNEEESYINEILSPFEKALEKEKEKLLADFIPENELHNKESYPTSQKLIVANKKVLFHFHNSVDTKTKEYIKSYLAPFYNDHDEIDHINIYYATFSNEFEDPNHKIWWEKMYYARTRKINETTFSVNHRNFIGLIKDEGMNCFFKGPKLEDGMSDTVDNAFLSFVAPSLISAKSLALHAATVIYKGEAYIFYGPSGVGKSTIAEFCNEKYGFKVMSGDQVYINLDQQGRLWAWPSVSTIPHFPRSSNKWCGEKTPVKAMIHLVRKEIDFSFFEKSVNEMVSSFLREVVYLPCLGKQDKLLDLALDVLKSKNVHFGDMSYQKNYDFWNDLINRLEE